MIGQEKYEEIIPLIEECKENDWDICIGCILFYECWKKRYNFPGYLFMMVNDIKKGFRKICKLSFRKRYKTGKKIIEKRIENENYSFNDEWKITEKFPQIREYTEEQKNYLKKLRQQSKKNFVDILTDFKEIWH